MAPTSHYDNIDYQLLVNVLDGVASPAEARLVAEWLEQSEQNRALYFSIKDILDYQRAAGMNIDTVKAWETVAAKLATAPKQRKLPLLRYAAMLAILLLAGGAAFYFFNGRQQSGTAMEDVLMYSETVQNTVLPDGTKVWLNKGGRLRFREGFGKTERDIWVEGTAYFEVSEHPQPFIIHADSIQVKVLATSFTVQANRLVASVIVNSGKVKAFFGAAEMLIYPNERVVMGKGGMKKEKVNAALFAAWRNGEYLFDNTDIEELKNVISSNYGLATKVLSPQSFKGSAISGAMKIDGEQSLKAVLEGTFNAKVKISEETLTIQPNN